MKILLLLSNLFIFSYKIAVMKHNISFKELNNQFKKKTKAEQLIIKHKIQSIDDLPNKMSVLKTEEYLTLLKHFSPQQ